MRFTTRIWIIVFASLIGLLSLAALGLGTMRQSMLEDRHKQIGQLLSFANAQFEYFYQQEQRGLMSREEAQAKAKEALGAMRHENDYFFVRSLSDDVMLVHPIANRVGKADNGGVMKDGRTLVQTYKDELTASGGNTAFVWGAAPHPDRAKAGDKTLYPKLSGIKKFDAWNWLIGIGFFVEDIDNFFWKEVKIFLAVSGLLILALGWLVLGMRNAILLQLGGEPENAVERMQRIANGDLAVDIPVKKNDNQSLMASLKLMQMKLNNISSAIHENAGTLNELIQTFDQMTKSYLETKSEEQFGHLLIALKKINRTVDALGKATSRMKI